MADFEGDAPETYTDELGTPTAHTNMAAARMAGYGWDEINGHLADATDQAKAVGYTQPEIDAHLGYAGDGALSSRLSTLAVDDKSVLEALQTGGGSEVPEAGATAPLPPSLAHAYATALATGETKGPDDFSRTFHGMFGTDDPITLGNMASQLPSNEDATDHAIATLHGNGDPLTPAGVVTTKNNMVDMWAETGMTPSQVLTTTDPLLSDALAIPQPPHQPTLAELEETRKDQINPFYTPFDYQSIIGFAKDFYNLPEEQGKFDDKIKAMQAAGATEAEITEAMRDSPTRNFFVPLIATAGLAKGIHAAGSAVAPKVGELFRDETGSVPLGQAKIEGVKKPATEAKPGEETPTPAEEKPTPEQMAADAKPGVQEQVDKIGAARKESVPELPPPEGVTGKVDTVPLEDDLNRLRTNDTADKVAMVKMVDSLPEEWKDHAFLERASTEVETRLTTPGAKLSPETQAFLDAMKPLTDRQADLAAKVRSKLSPKEAAEFDMATPDEGYVRRSVINNERGVNLLDPQAVQEDVITGGRPRTLSKYAPSTKGRTQYVFEDEETGARHFGTRPLDEIDKKMGERITDDPIGNYTVKPATMEEVEANTKVRYNKNFLVNTIDNTLALERVNRNLDILAKHRDDMMMKGLFVPDKVGELGPSGMRRVDLPQMKGWANPKIANVLNDFFQENASRGDLLGALTRANRFLMSSLFISPVVHIGNVGAHWAPSRGWDWVKPSGYGSLMRDGFDAAREVWTMGPRYIEHLREGSGLLYASTQTENFHQMMLNKLMHEIAGDKNTWGSYAKSLGFKAVGDLVNTMYRQSRRALWMVGDMFMLQRQFELERTHGLAMRDAIFQAEKDIPNYRVPSEVLGSHKMGELLRSPNFLNFGRYKYGQIRAIYLTVRDMVGPARSASERLEAAGKATILAAMGMGVYPLINAGLQNLTGNKDAEVKPFGPLSVINAAIGFAQGQKSWLAAVSSFVTAAPVWDLANKLRTNKDVFGRDIISDKATPLGKGIQALEAAAKQFYPGQLLVDAMKPGGVAKSAGNLVGLNLATKPDPKQQAKWDKRDAAIAKARERKDPIESWVRNQLSLQLPADPGKAYAGAGSSRGNFDYAPKPHAGNPNVLGSSSGVKATRRRQVDNTGGATVLRGQ